ncbi:MAG: DUF1501 domain-containing protein [Chitinophagales bacterium]|jgi:uncharacterized protein (DUF1501 family)|nr:DUF1501 domain-containing protein [Chitinophagales bacterium]
MKRRDFLKYTTGSVVLPTLLNGFCVQTLAASPFIAATANTAVETDRVLVLVYLYGGNDGLNTVIPLDKYAALNNVRSNVIIPENAVLPLNGVTTIGLHPAMTGMQQLFNDGKLKIIQSVGYPNPDFSHFRSTDIWLTASNTDQYLSTGWMGRYLEQQYPGYPVDYPTTDMPDPLAIGIGSNQSLLFQGEVANTCMAVSDPTWFYNLATGTTEPTPNTQWGEQLAYLRLIAQQSNTYGTTVQNAYYASANLGSYPSDNQLAEQLRIVARLIAGGLKTRVYLVGIDGFDTHAGQVESWDTTQGAHAQLLSKLSGAISAFMNDLSLLQLDHRVVGMTLSEFGRRIISNGSTGTDHGTSSPHFVFGTPIAGGVLGVTPDIPATSDEDDNIPHQYDFRSIYATMLSEWLCNSPEDTQSVLLQDFATLPILTQNCNACTLPTPTISGNDQACGSNTFVYTANSPTEGGTFNWTVVGGTIVAGQGTNQLTVQWDSGTAGSLEVQQVLP